MLRLLASVLIRNHTATGLLGTCIGVRMCPDAYKKRLACPDNIHRCWEKGWQDPAKLLSMHV